MPVNARKPAASSARRQGGLSLVELMVGITVGLFVVAAAATLTAGVLSDNRRLLLETQVQQDLRATMDIITRQLRRAGAGTSADVQAGIAATPSAGGASNAFGVITPSTSTSSETQFKFYFDADQQGPFGFKLENGVVKTLLIDATGGRQWQDLTDANTLVVTSFLITPRILSSTALPCPNLCPINPTLDPTGARQYCWPQLVVRSYTVDIQAHAKSDLAVRRALRNEVRVRNDIVNFTGSAPVCPT